MKLTKMYFVKSTHMNRRKQISAIYSNSTEYAYFKITRESIGHLACSMRSSKAHDLKKLHWRHNDHDGVSNHQPHGCLLNRLFRRRSKKTSKLRVTGLCVGNSPGPVNSPHKWPVTRKMFPFNDVIMIKLNDESITNGAISVVCFISYDAWDSENDDGDDYGIATRDQ